LLFVRLANGEGIGDETGGFGTTGGHFVGGRTEGRKAKVGVFGRVGIKDVGTFLDRK